MLFRLNLSAVSLRAFAIKDRVKQFRFFVDW
jgi:hypothetical protein